MKKISIIGLGYVGLPLACILGYKKNKNLQVVGVDKKLNYSNITKKEFLDDFSKKLSDAKLKRIIKQSIKNQAFEISGNLQKVVNSNVIVISINFDFDKKNIDIAYKSLKSFFYSLSQHLNSKTLIVLETTVPPGTSEKIIYPTIEKVFKKRGLKEKPLYSYSYERVMPGLKYYDSIVNIRRCYSGIDKQSSIACKNFLKSIINVKKYPLYKLEKTRDCETSKILENSYRALNIAFIDEWTKYANSINVNLNKVIDGIKLRKTHINIMRPGVGVGGYCLTKDPVFSKISSRYIFKKQNNFPLTLKSVEINENMPRNSFNFIKKNLPNKPHKILMMGAAYRQDVDDIRNSPSIKLFNLLKKKSNIIKIYDPVVKDLKKNKNLTQELPNFRNYDVVIFSVPHRKFKKISFSKLPKKPYYFDINMVLEDKIKKFLKKNNYKIKILGDD